MFVKEQTSEGSNLKEHPIIRSSKSQQNNLYVKRRVPYEKVATDEGLTLKKQKSKQSERSQDQLQDSFFNKNLKKGFSFYNSKLLSIRTSQQGDLLKRSVCGSIESFKGFEDKKKEEKIKKIKILVKGTHNVFKKNILMKAEAMKVSELDDFINTVDKNIKLRSSLTRSNTFL